MVRFDIVHHDARAGFPLAGGDFHVVVVLVVLVVLVVVLVVVEIY